MPLDVNTVPWTLRLDDTRVTSLGAVTSWTDLSGNGKNMTGSGPTVGTATPTGKDSIAFDGANDKFTSSYPLSDFITSTTATVYVVCKPTAFSAAGYFYGEGCMVRDNGGSFGIYAGPGPAIGAWVADTWPWPNPTTSATVSTWYVVALRLQAGGACSISLDGGATWVTDTAGDPIGSLSGSLELGYGAAAWFTGEMAAVYMLDSAQSDADVGDVFAYLKDRFILPASVSVSVDNAKLSAVPVLPSPIVTVGVNVTAAKVASVATLPNPTVTIGASVLGAKLDARATLPSPTVTAEAEAAPIVVMRTTLHRAYLPPMTLRRAE